jgi:hypothetical protein
VIFFSAPELVCQLGGCDRSVFLGHVRTQLRHFDVDLQLVEDGGIPARASSRSSCTARAKLTPCNRPNNASRSGSAAQASKRPLVQLGPDLGA